MILRCFMTFEQKRERERNVLHEQKIQNFYQIYAFFGSVRFDCRCGFMITY
jgi:hypothetical protein